MAVPFLYEELGERVRNNLLICTCTSSYILTIHVRLSGCHPLLGLEGVDVIDSVMLSSSWSGKMEMSLELLTMSMATAPQRHV